MRYLLVNSIRSRFDKSREPIGHAVIQDHLTPVSCPKSVGGASRNVLIAFTI
jgi:hypothetical protein